MTDALFSSALPSNSISISKTQNPFPIPLIFQLNFSPVKTPCRSPNPVFFHVPARTAGLLLEAALRIQKQSTTARSKSFGKSNGLGLLGSFLKRLTHRSRSRKREIHGDGRINDPRDGPPLPAKMAIEENEKENDSVFRLSNVTGFDFCESNLCDSPFRFVLQSSSSPGHRTPELSSPVSSPARLDHQANDVESLQKLPAEDEEEEKEQSSPVSILDPPFEDDDEGNFEDGEDEDDYNLERSFAIVQSIHNRWHLYLGSVKLDIGY
ncbi:histone-lysine N-methyltransferase SETD1B-like isoform X2 [Cucumis melo var. makuwa]|uniref:Histone-lysine N-methyltransferase SETD1B-like isoform X2 n=1 Tax=Cucumis melo var. makuwa TaxID=1194695 RepID=A0A5A7VAA2_CUCMM|nr:histone-lysine N-methyltransferase SETD1B-like isoform X2 [Cucumis melo var. makuwa]